MLSARCVRLPRTCHMVRSFSFTSARARLIDDGSGFVPADAVCRAVRAQDPALQLFAVDTAGGIMGARTASLLFSPTMPVSAAEAAGVRADADVVLYDNGRMSSAARAWVWLTLLGLPRVFVVNGGLAACALLPGVRVLPEGADLAPYSPTALPGFGPQPRALEKGVRYVTLKEVVKQLGTATQLVDARTPEEYNGTKPMTNPRPGKIPGGVLMNDLDILTPSAGSTLISPQALEAMVKAQGLDKSRPVITYCQRGYRAATVAMALRSIGFADVSVYSGSFGEWSASDAPVELSA